ncbi:thioredoxin-related transmembrane protein 1 [Calliphora vicina]|uniref:thioredoxin-related transmembrane protein 1 n=1 Tax=Calliphora vicina TaxID=7373 RepID=UPI00325BB72C
MQKLGTGGSNKMQQRSWALLAIFLVSCFVVVTKVQASLQIEPVQKQQSLIELNEDNWRQMFKGEWMVEFFAPWCPACKNLAPVWERFAASASEINVNVAKIDVTTSPSLSGRFYVTALPTIYHVKDGEFRQYRGSRDGDALMFFVRQKQWTKLEPISSWKKPDTIHMSVLSYFFKLSHTLKDFNGRLQEEYGLPTWGSYALFTIGTIFVGAALGLMLVCVVDFLYPPKKLQRQSFSESKENSRNDIEDIANDEIEDDRPQNDDEDDEDDDDEEAIDEEDDDNENASTEDEKQTHSESEEPESESKSEKKQTGDKPSPSEVRKRKPRKAD